jgi:hypothetical protein
MTRTRQSTTANPRSRAAGLLACGHPAGQNNLVNGKCGTCLSASELEEMADRNKDETSEILRTLAKIFREGKIVYDRKGKSLLEWEKFFNKKKQANVQSSGTRG